MFWFGVGISFATTVIYLLLKQIFRFQTGYFAFVVDSIMCTILVVNVGWLAFWGYMAFGVFEFLLVIGVVAEALATKSVFWMKVLNMLFTEEQIEKMLDTK
jgi:hypothetical protein